MTGGYAGKILRVNLTTKEISRIDTAKYEEFGGGAGGGGGMGKVQPKTQAKPKE